MAIEKIGPGLPDSNSWAKLEKRQTAPDIAKQFDAVFLQSMQKSDSIEKHFIHEASPFAANKQENVACAVDRQTTPTTTQTNQLNQQPVTVNAEAPLAVKTLLSADSFIQSIWPYAVQAASLIGLDPKLLMAQAALETGWGHFIVSDSQGNSSNNLFNIKSPKHYDGDSVVIKTTEYLANTPIKMTASFKSYPTLEHSFQDYLDLIQGNARYKEAVANAHDPKAYADALQKAGYATDPEYANKILAIYQGAELQQALDRAGLM